jgi:Reverse transcriptase (RNA-dependent DNA polymerase)
MSTGTNLDYILKNKMSMIRPRAHGDGRIIIMDYEKSFEKTRQSLVKSFGRRFVVHTDIANFFPSIYSHAIPWATVGFEYAKKHKSPKFKAEWFNVLDEKMRLTKRNETQGVAIGPATSNIVSETILTRVDQALGGKFSYTRFIDDYTGYCDTEEEAQDFIRQLAEELSKYKLLLNARKTEIIPLPRALAADWVTELSLSLPKVEVVSAFDAVNYLNLAVRLAQQSPDGSVLKYALKSLLGKKLGFMADVDVLRYALNLCFHQPVLLPLLEKLFESTMLFGVFLHAEQLTRLTIEHARMRRSDAMSWALYYQNRFNVPIDDSCADVVVASRDCIPLLLLYLSGVVKHQKRVVDFAKALDRSDLYGLDQYWLLLYELFLDKAIPTPYAEEDAFEILAAQGVSFVQAPKLVDPDGVLQVDPSGVASAS